MVDWEVRCVCNEFGRSECLADKDGNPLGALSRIKPVDSKSHEVKR